MKSQGHKAKALPLFLVMISLLAVHCGDAGSDLKGRIGLAGTITGILDLATVAPGMEAAYDPGAGDKLVAVALGLDGKEYWATLKADGGFSITVPPNRAYEVYFYEQNADGSLVFLAVVSYNDGAVWRRFFNVSGIVDLGTIQLEINGQGVQVGVPDAAPPAPTYPPGDDPDAGFDSGSPADNPGNVIILGQDGRLSFSLDGADALLMSDLYLTLPDSVLLIDNRQPTSLELAKVYRAGQEVRLAIEVDGSPMGLGTYTHSSNSGYARVTALSSTSWRIEFEDLPWYLADWDFNDLVTTMTLTPFNCDQDGDGEEAVACGGPDCDDGNSTVNTGAAETLCDGIDQNCNGLADDDQNTDGDSVSFCGGDCNDNDPGIYPGAAETMCDGIDQNCNGLADDDGDSDGDGWSDCWEQRYSVCGFDPLSPDADQVFGGVGGEIRVTLDPNASTSPRVAWSGSEFGMVWTDDRSGTPEFYFARMSATGKKLSPDLRMSYSVQDGHAPSIVWTGSEFGVAWSGIQIGGANDYAILFCRISASGQKIKHEIPLKGVGVYQDSAPSLVWTGSEFGVSWQSEDFDNDIHDIYFGRVSAAGVKIGTETRITSNPGPSVSPSLAWTGSQYGLSWKDHSTGDDEIYFARISRFGSKLATDVRVTSAAGASSSPSLSWTGSEFALAYDDNRDGAGGEIYFSRLSATGGLIAEARITNDPAASAAASLLWTGSEFAVSWQDGRDGNGEVYFARLAPDGSRTSGDVRVTSDPAASGGPAMTWTGSEFGLGWNDQRDGNDEIYFTRLDDHVSDRDGDRLSDRDEYLAGTDPCDPDTDGDGMGDGWEVNYAVCASLDPLTADNGADDLDSDGLTNQGESAAWTDPCVADTDGDGLPDDWEAAHPCLDPVSGDAINDPDGDLATNADEYECNSDPCSSDYGTLYPVQLPGAFYFGDANGDGRVAEPDLGLLNVALWYGSTGCPFAEPGNCDNLDVNTQGMLDPADFSQMNACINTGACQFSAVPASLSKVQAPGVISQGGTANISAMALDNLSLPHAPRAGWGVVFEIDPATTCAATLIGRDPNPDKCLGQDQYITGTKVFEYTGSMATGGEAAVLVNAAGCSAGDSVVINAYIPSDAEAGIWPGRFPTTLYAPSAFRLLVVAGMDADGDGFDQSVDCDDGDSAIYPGAPETLCDGIDQNCNGLADDDKNTDGDAVSFCNGDCDDGNPAVYPGASETLCDGIDQNCNGMADDDKNTDGDPVSFCNGDCDDTNPGVYPGAPEICDGVDNQCPGDAGYGFADTDCYCGGPGVYSAGPEFLVDTRGSAVFSEPDIASDLNNNYTITWGGDTAGYARRYDPSGNPLGPTFQVNSPGLYPAIATNGSNDFIIAYNGISVQRYNLDGDTIGTWFTAGAGTAAAIAVGGDDSMIVSWMNTPPSDYMHVYARRFDSSGNPLGSEFRVDSSTSYCLRPTVGADHNNNFLIAWEDQRIGPSDTVIYARHYDSNGSPLGPEFQVNQSATGWAPSMKVDGNDNFIITWYGGGAIYARRYDSSLNPIGSEFRVDQGGPAAHPDISVDGSNNVIIAWYDWRSGDMDVYARVFDSGNNPLSSEFRVDQGPSGDARNMGVAADGNGNFIVTWEDDRSGDWDIYARMYTKMPADEDCDGVADSIENATGCMDELNPDTDGDGRCDGNTSAYDGPALICTAGEDMDTDGVVDAGESDPCVVDSATCVDQDGDGHGIGLGCASTVDCDDGDSAVYPGAPELCDGQDNQCPGDAGYGGVDEGCGTDGDGDGFDSSTDCDDSNVAIYPGAPELCDCIDNQCPGDAGYGTVDEGCGGKVPMTFKSGRLYFCNDQDNALTSVNGHAVELAIGDTACSAVADGADCWIRLINRDTGDYMANAFIVATACVGCAGAQFANADLSHGDTVHGLLEDGNAGAAAAIDGGGFTYVEDGEYINTPAPFNQYGAAVHSLISTGPPYEKPYQILFPEAGQRSALWSLRGQATPYTFLATVLTDYFPWDPTAGPDPRYDFQNKGTFYVMAANLANNTGIGATANGQTWLRPGAYRRSNVMSGWSQSMPNLVNPVTNNGTVPAYFAVNVAVEYPDYMETQTVADYFSSQDYEYYYFFAYVLRYDPTVVELVNGKAGKRQTPNGTQITGLYAIDLQDCDSAYCGPILGGVVPQTNSGLSTYTQMRGTGWIATIFDMTLTSPTSNAFNDIHAPSTAVPAQYLTFYGGKAVITWAYNYANYPSYASYAVVPGNNGHYGRAHLNAPKSGTVTWTASGCRSNGCNIVAQEGVDAAPEMPLGLYYFWTKPGTSGKGSEFWIEMLSSATLLKTAWTHGTIYPGGETPVSDDWLTLCLPSQPGFEDDSQQGCDLALPASYYWVREGVENVNNNIGQSGAAVPGGVSGGGAYQQWPAYVIVQ